MFFEGQVVVGLDLLEQEGFEFGWDQSGSACWFEWREVVEVSVELEVAVDARGTDAELSGHFFWWFVVVVDGLDNSGSEVY